MQKISQKRLYKIGIDASRAFVSEPTGVEYYSLNIIKKLAEIDKVNDYILYLRPGQQVNFTIPQNFKIKTINMRYLWTQVGLARELFVNPVDLLFVPAHTLPLLSKWVMRELPVVVTVHGLEGKYLPQSGNYLAHIYRNWSIEWSVKYADRLIAVSQDTMQDVVKTYQVEAKKLRVIHEGVDLKRFSNTKLKEKRPSAKNNAQSSRVLRKYGIEGDYILFVGTVQPRKNLERLIQAFAKVLELSNSKPIASSREDSKTTMHASIGAKNGTEKKNNINTKNIKNIKNNFSLSLKLVIAGGYGWMYEPITYAPKKFGIEDKVIFTGRIDDSELEDLYKEAKAFVLPSITEGFGLPVLEAQAAGVPVVASTGGALKEVGGEGALYVNPLSVGEIKEALMKVLTNKNIRENLTKKGYQNVLGFSWEQAAHNSLKYFIEILENKEKAQKDNNQ